MAVNAGSPEWTEEEIGESIAVLQKIALTQDAGKNIPGLVYEAHLRSKKNISTEVVIFNEKDEVYLVERPSLEENPSEPFPGELHSPGVTHMKKEMEYDTFKRIVRQEFGGKTIRRATKVDEMDNLDERRGMYRYIIYLAEMNGEPLNPKGRFYAWDDIPWDRVVKAHREALLPIAYDAHLARTGRR